MIRRLLLALPFLLLAGCSGGGFGGDSGAGSSENAGGSPELDLYEAVVRHLLPRAQEAAGEKRPAVHVFLPPGADMEKFCRRFEGGPVPVLSRLADAAGDPDQSAYLIRIDGSGSGAAGEVRVFVRDYPASETPRCGTPYPISLRRQGDRWVVADR
jgi:hypothetical protein